LATNTKVHNFNFLHKPEKTSLRMWKLWYVDFHQFCRPACIMVLS
jgi:hypothetical protein